MSTNRVNTPRRSFLGKIAAGAVALGAAGVAAPIRSIAALRQPAPSTDPTDFDRWLQQCKGKHRQVFDAPAANNGLPLAWSRVFLMSNKQQGVADDDVTTVLVLRHEGIPVAMNSDLWAKYGFGKMFKVTDAVTKSDAVRNPFYQVKAGELPLPGMALEDLMKDGVLIGVCDMALTVYSIQTGKTLNRDADEIKKEWISGVIPGIQVVPSGVLAVNRAQEHGCTYCFAG